MRLLSDAAVATRAVFCDARKIRPRSGPRVVWTQADLRDPGALEPALAGTTRLFLLSDNQAGFGALQVGVLQAAQALGVAHVVKVSALGASDHSGSWIAREHWQVEQALNVLTGPEAVGFKDVAAILSELTGWIVTYRPISMDDARARMDAKGAPPEQVEAMLAFASYQKAGGPTAQVSDAVAHVIGKPPRTVRDFLRDHADRFGGQRPVREETP